nr:reverse transcriptase domain-containing protein [Tanacetum cinerariifolium]
MQNQINSLKGEFKNEIQNTMKTQQTVLMEQQNAFQNNLQNMLSGFLQNQASTSGTLRSNTISNPKGEMKAITTQSGVIYEGPSIPTNPSPKKVVEREIEETTDKEQTNFQGSTAHIQPPVTPIMKPDDKLFELANIPLNENCLAMLLKKLSKKLGDLGKFLIPCKFLGMDVCHALADLGPSINIMPLSIWKKISLPELTPTRMTLELEDQSITGPKGVAKKVFVKVGKFHFLTDFVVVDFEPDPRVPLILGRSFLRTGRALIDVYGEEITLRVNDEAVTFNLNQTTRYSSTYNDLSINRIDIIDVAREEYAQDILGFSKNSFGGNPTLTFEPILFDFSPSLTQFEGNDFILEDIEAYLKDDSISSKIDHADCDPEGDICLIEKLMPFGLFNAVGTFKRCMMAIFHDMIEKTMEVFMDDFLVFEDSFSSCLSYLDTILQRCEDTNLVLNWEKCHFMVKELIILGHKIYKNGLEVDRAKVDVIAKLPYPTTVKGVRSFIGHAGFYQRFIQYFSKIARPMTDLLEKETPFVFSKDCIDAFETLKKKVTEASILVVHDWNLPFELMCIVYTDYSALKYLLSKQDAKPRLIRWVLLLQEFDIIIRDKKGTENLAADHLSRLKNPHKDVFTLGKISSGSTPWFADFANFHAGNFIVKGMSSQQKKKFFKNVKHYFWDDPYLF